MEEKNEQESGLSSFFKELKNAVFEEVPERKEEPAETVATVHGGSATAAINTPVAAASDAISSQRGRNDDISAICQAIVADLQNALGSDSACVRFIDALKSLEGDVADEVLRYRAALKVLKLDPAGLSTDINRAVGLLDAKRQTELAKLDEKEKREVGALEANHADIEQQIVDFAAKLQELQKQKEELGVQIAANKSKLSSARTTLTLAFDDVKVLVASYAAKLGQYMK